MNTMTYNALMLDYVAGTLPVNLATACDLHVLCSDEGASSAHVWADVRGALLSEAGRAPTSETEDIQDRFETSCTLLKPTYDDIKWRRGLSGAKYSKLPHVGGQYMKLEPGKSVPTHGHRGLELTVVLEGNLTDGHGIYRRGDLAIGEPGLRHKPAAHGDSACICFVAKAS